MNMLVIFLVSMLYSYVLIIGKSHFFKILSDHFLPRNIIKMLIRTETEDYVANCMS